MKCISLYLVVFLNHRHQAKNSCETKQDKPCLKLSVSQNNQVNLPVVQNVFIAVE